MPKSKKRKSRGRSDTSGPKYGAGFGKTSKRTNILGTVLGAAVVLGGGAYWWSSSQNVSQIKSETETLVQAGRAALADVQTSLARGNNHLGLGDTIDYGTSFPTSGDHAATSVNPGFYSRAMPSTGLVHSLEHGSIVIYYDTPGPEAVSQLREWAGIYDGPWDGVVVTRFPGLKSEVILTAWTQSLRLAGFDAAASAAFMDAYRGRGPERSVR